jgi:signal peptidase II
VSAPSGRARWPIFLGIAATVVILDQLSKAWLVSMLEPGERMEIIGDLVRFIHAQNSGALFGLFRDQALLFAIVSIGVVALIVWYHGSSGRNTLLSIALGLLLGGALGNMIDRFRLGYVTDWVDIGLGDLRFYTFNVADSAISLAILLLLVLAVWPTREPAKDPPATEPPASAEVVEVDG